MTRTLIFAAAGLAASLPAVSVSAQSTPPAAAAQGDVVVTGVRLKDSEAALKTCVARGCPPDEDIRATLAHAENQFVAGDYGAANRTLAASIRRNGDAAKRYPVPVSDLYRAHSRVAINLGEANAFRFSTLSSLDALKAGLSSDDRRVLAQRIEVADMFARLGLAEQALDGYRGVAKDADKAHNMLMVGYARLRLATLYSVLADVDEQGGYAARSADAIRWLLDNRAPELAAFRGAAELLSARRSARAGDAAAIDRLVARYARSTTRPVLLYAPPLQTETSGRAKEGGSTTSMMAVGSFENQWVDVSFWVTPQGKVSDAAILRESSTLDRSWVKPIVAGIAQRRYAPLKMDAAEPGLLRVERYTQTAHWMDATGTRIRQREAIPRIEMVDLTADPAPPPSADAPVQSTVPVTPNTVG